MTAELKLVAEWFGAIGAVSAVLSPLIIGICRFFRRLSKRLERLEEQNASQQNDINISLEERRMMLEGIYACLDGLRQQGCNGRVSSALEALDSYIIAAAHRSSDTQRSNNEHFN